MNHFTVPSFWDEYNKLPTRIQQIADKNFELLKKDQKHPSLHFKKIKNYYSARVGKKYRAIAIQVEEGAVWFWIGSHSQYDDLLKQ